MFPNVLTSMVALSVLTSILSGCAFSAGSPHENFKSHLYAEVGKSIENAPSYSWRHEKDLIAAKSLPNGNIENKYRYRGSCVYFFEIDPKTRTIVGARFEGKETDCIVNP